MTAKEKVARRKLSLLELADDLSNVSRACRAMGYSRQQFYEIRRNFQLYGSEGLLDRVPGCKGVHPNRLAPEMEEAVLDYSLEKPSHGCLRVSQQLALRGILVSSKGVRGVWGRHNLLTQHQRFLRLEKSVSATDIKLTEDQIRVLERFDPEFRERHIETRHTGYLVAVDTFFVGTLKGIGKVYLQSALDCHSRYAWGRLYTNKLPITAVQVLNNDVLPFFDSHDAKIDSVLSDNGSEYCGKKESHPYELFLQLEEIAHRTTRVRRPQSNGFIERFHRTVLNEHFRIKGRTKWYETLAEMQQDLDDYLVIYNTIRAHQGIRMQGRTPYKVFVTDLPNHTGTNDNLGTA